jgi:hypothetical protein
LKRRNLFFFTVLKESMHIEHLVTSSLAHKAAYILPAQLADGGLPPALAHGRAFLQLTDTYVAALPLTHWHIGRLSYRSLTTMQRLISTLQIWVT